MTFTTISDTHGYHRQLKLSTSDVIIHAGDICHYGSDEQLRDFLIWYSELDFEYKILVCGNHDFLNLWHFKGTLKTSSTLISKLGNTGAAEQKTSITREL